MTTIGRCCGCGQPILVGESYEAPRYPHLYHTSCLDSLLEQNDALVEE